MALKVWKKFRTHITVLTLAMASIVGTTTHVLANEQPSIQISQWAIGTLNEGEHYGIYPVTWYYDDFLKPISNERFKQLVDATGNKLASLNLAKNQNFKTEQFEMDGTRGSVIQVLYNTIAQYELPFESEITKLDAAEYFQKRNILKGTEKGFELDKPCTVEQAVILATKLVEDTYNALDAGSKGFLWKVEKGQNTVYLLGSIHMGNSDLYPVSNTLKNAFKTSDVLIVEASLAGNQEGVNDFLKVAMYQDGTTLKDHVTMQTYEKALKVFELVEIPAETYVQFKPWSITNDLNVLVNSKAQGSGDDTEAARLGIDHYFTNTAIVAQKPVAELEGLKFQAELFDSISPKFQEEQLATLLDAILKAEEPTQTARGATKDEEKQSDKGLVEWQKNWHDGDVESFKNSFENTLENEKNELDEMLFGKRDQNMATKLIDLLEKEGKATYFVVVGAGHLTIKDTVIDQLIHKGYKVERIQ